MDINQITDDRLRACLTDVTGEDPPAGDGGTTLADEIGIDDDFSYTSFDFEQTTDRLVHAVFGTDATPPLADLPPGCDFGFDLIADGEGASAGGRFLLYLPRSLRLGDRPAPLLASGYVKAKHFGDRDLTGLELAVSILHDARITFAELLDAYHHLAPVTHTAPGDTQPAPAPDRQSRPAAGVVDPNETLRIIRVAVAMTQRIAATGTDHIDECWRDLAEAAQALDTWLGNGGLPPTDWTRPVSNG
jgi:hypothetical protein